MMKDAFVHAFYGLGSLAALVGRLLIGMIPLLVLFAIVYLAVKAAA